MTKHIRFNILILLGLIPTFLFSQKSGEIADCYRDTISDNSEVFTEAEIRPYFKGGLSSLFNYINTNINHQAMGFCMPQSDSIYKDTVVAWFIISREATMSNLSVRMVKKEAFRNEIFRLMKKSACNWEPGHSSSGRPVDTWFQVGICYSLVKTNNGISSEIKLLDIEMYPK
jgi:hypothetical protein